MVRKGGRDGGVEGGRKEGRKERIRGVWMDGLMTICPG